MLKTFGVNLRMGRQIPWLLSFYSQTLMSPGCSISALCFNSLNPFSILLIPLAERSPQRLPAVPHNVTLLDLDLLHADRMSSSLARDTDL